MTGTVTVFSDHTLFGVIEDLEGGCFKFELTAVLQYDRPALRVGKRVYFDMEYGSLPKAVNISIEPSQSAASGKDRRAESGDVRYIGFEHQGTIRTFRFQKTTRGEPVETFSIDADLMLFRRYQIHLQEGPAICLGVLLAALAAAPLPRPLGPLSLNGENIVSFLASRPEPRPKPRFKKAVGARPLNTARPNEVPVLSRPGTAQNLRIRPPNSFDEVF